MLIPSKLITVNTIDNKNEQYHANEILRQDNEKLVNEKGKMLEHISISQDRIKIFHYELS